MTRGCELRHAPEACVEDLGKIFEKSQLVEFLRPNGRVDIETWARRDEFARYVYRTWCGGADGKVSIERLCLSPYVEKPLNSKVIKSFVPELRSRKCFSCLRIPMLYMNILCTFHIFMHGYVTHTYILSSTDRSVSFYQNSSVWLDILDSRSWDRNPVDSNANPRLYTSATRKRAATK